MSTGMTADNISRLVGLLGPAVLLPWPSGTKGDRRKWKHLQLADMKDTGYLAKLERAGNIGVALGQVSNGLVTIDLDQDGYVDALLKANPLVNNTLRTRAVRGCNIWLRFSGGYPLSQSLKNVSGSDVGEWRADGNQTIISGTHPQGVPYRFVVERPVITVSYDAIIWPESIVAPRRVTENATESNRVRRVGENEVVSECSASGGYSSIKAFLTENVMSQVAPTEFHQNNASLFKLARLVRDYEGATGELATQAELQVVFDRWCVLAQPFWRHTRDDYWAEFLEAYSYARIGFKENPLELAISRAKAAPLPELIGFTDKRIRLLVAICRELQAMTAPSPFFVPTRKLTEVLAVHWTHIARWLRVLERRSKVIRLAPGEVRKRGGNRCPRYHYGQPESEKFAV